LIERAATLELDLRTVTAAREVGARVIDACRKARRVIARTNAELGRHRAFWDEALSSHAERVAIDESARTGHATGNLWSDVSFDPAQPKTFRHSCSAQPLHTDGSYIADPPPVVFMVCKRSAPEGGATLFLDGPDLIRTLSSEQPELYRRLTTEPVTFSKGGSEVESLVLAPDDHSLHLRWNYYALSTQLSAAARVLADRFRDFLADVARRPVTSAVVLQPGDAAFFHDGELLHGRESFVASAAGERFLWKGGLRI
jgi:alpha-ketoglutarate-dependent taurine dioxygenase